MNYYLSLLLNNIYIYNNIHIIKKSFRLNINIIKMKFNKTLLLFANLLAASAHFVKRDNTGKTFDVYKVKIPDSFKDVVKEASEDNKSWQLTKHVVKVEENFINIEKGKHMKTVFEDPFNLMVHCYYKDCGDYPNSVQKGAGYIADALEFYNEVNVNVTIFPFCEFSDDSSSCKSIMGITYPPTFVALKETENDDPFLYPQALVKQLEVDTNIDFEPIDFQIYLNSDYHPDPSQDNRDLIAAHEIIHGLGFFHQINPVSVYINNYKNYFRNDFALPPISYFETDDKIIFEGWTPFSIFDKYIVSTANPSDYLHRKLIKYTDHDIKVQVSTRRPTNAQYNAFKSAFQALENDKEANEGGVEVAKLFSTLNAVGFHTKDGKVVELQTFDGTYESASSISHTNVPFSCKSSSTCNVSNNNLSITENYLMYFTVISRASTNKLINIFKSKSKHKLISDDIVSIMCTLGWNEKNGDKSGNGSSYTLYSDSTRYTPTCIMTILSFIFYFIMHLI